MGWALFGVDKVHMSPVSLAKRSTTCPMQEGVIIADPTLQLQSSNCAGTAVARCRDALVYTTSGLAALAETQETAKYTYQPP